MEEAGRALVWLPGSAGSHGVGPDLGMRWLRVEGRVTTGRAAMRGVAGCGAALLPAVSRWPGRSVRGMKATVDSCIVAEAHGTKVSRDGRAPRRCATCVEVAPAGPADLRWATHRGRGGAMLGAIGLVESMAWWCCFSPVARCWQ
jgi:hypothetical protein